VKYRITEVGGWFIVGLSGKAENNEPLKVKYLFRRWLTSKAVRLIMNFKEIEEPGVWEFGLLTSFKKEIDQRGGVLRVCELKTPSSKFGDDRFLENFEIFPDLESAMEGRSNDENGE